MLINDFNIIVDKNNKFIKTENGLDYYGNTNNIYYESLTKHEVEKFILTVKISKIPYGRSGDYIINSPEDRLKISKRLLTARVPFVKETMNDFIKMCSEQIEESTKLRRTYVSNSFGFLLVNETINSLLNYKKNWESVLKAMRPKNKFIKDKITELDIQKAREYPITNLIQFGSNGFTKCIFHDEATGSMKYYPQSNTVHCFGCNTSADAIAVAERMWGENFINTVKKLSGKN